MDLERCQDANGESGGGGNLSAPRNGVHRLRVGKMARWKRMNACDGGWRSGEQWQKKKTPPGKGPQHP